MEGLIPFLLRSVKKQRPKNSYRSLSEISISNRSYHPLVGPDSVEDGSSHRRTRSELPAPASTEYADYLSRSISINKARGSNNNEFKYNNRQNIGSSAYSYSRDSKTKHNALNV